MTKKAIYSKNAEQTQQKRIDAYLLTKYTRPTEEKAKQRMFEAFAWIFKAAYQIEQEQKLTDSQHDFVLAAVTQFMKDNKENNL